MQLTWKYVNSCFLNEIFRFSIFIILISFILGWWPVKVVGEIPNNDKMVKNIFSQIFVCIFSGSPEYFSADNFLNSMMLILLTLSNGEFKDSSQLELLEYCWWSNTTVNLGSYCRYGGLPTSGANYTLVRYGVAVADVSAVLKLDYNSLHSLATAPVLQTTDPAIFIPGEVNPSFTQVVLMNNVTTKVLGIILILIVVSLICGILLWLFIRDRRKEKERSVLVRRVMGGTSTSAQRQQQQQQQHLGSRYNRELEVTDEGVGVSRNEFRWGGTDIEMSTTRMSSYWPSSTNVQTRERQEWHEKDLASKPTNPSNKE